VGTSPPTVLVLRALGLGDALTGVPALRGLRRAFPGSRLVLAAPEHLGAWLVRHALVDATVPADQRLLEVSGLGGPPDVAVDLHGRGPRSHRLLLGLSPGQLVAFACAEAGHLDGPSWTHDVHEVDRWCALVRGAGGPCGPEDLRLDDWARQRGRYAVLHPGASAPARAWPVDRWGALARRLLAEGTPVVLTGGMGERPQCAGVFALAPGAVDRSGRTGLDELASVVAGAALVVCGDTGVAHLATACQTPSVLLFGPSTPMEWGPRVDEHLHRVLWHPEVPSEADPHAPVVDPRLLAISVDEVLHAAAGLLDTAA
jgi:ADP-heptose:LPS heptosyltransferase